LVLWERGIAMPGYKFIGGLHDGEVHKVCEYLDEVEIDYTPPRFSFSFDGAQPATYTKRITSKYIKRMIKCDNDMIEFFVSPELTRLSTADLMKYILLNYNRPGGQK
jgi:hypothetical protein